MSGEENAPADKAATPQCQFFVQRKKRLCRMTVKPGRRYCGEHEPQPTTEAGQADKRIPCPNDPKHTCYASKLMKHLAICNARRTEQPPYIVHNINAPEEVEPCPRRPLSSIPKEELDNLVDKVNHLYAKHVEGQITEEPTPPIHRAVLGEFNEAGRAESSRRHLRQVSALLALAEREGLARDRTCYVELGAGKGQLSYYACHAWCGGGGSRVLAIDRAPLRHKRDNKLRSAPPTNTHGDPATHTESANGHSRSTGNSNVATPTNSINENTANTLGNSDISNENTDQNKNISSIRNDQATNDEQASCGSPTKIESKNNMLESSSNSTKDTTHQSNDNTDRISVDVEQNNTASKDQITKADKQGSGDSSNQEAEWKGAEVAGGEEGGMAGGEGGEVAVRVRADLAHLALEAVPVVVAAKGVVGLAKHLCGVATDYALRCVAAPGVLNKTRGIVLATCCHHRVERAPYVGTQHLEELGISAEEFNIILGVVSWATCGDGRSRERARAGHPARASHRLSQREREEVGRRAKALVDWGRVLWLRARGFDARLVYYVARDISPENVAVIARR